MEKSMLRLMDLLTEGVYDKGIFKAVFLAGGPGSGKSYVAKQLFGIPDKYNISVTGMKMINQDKELKYLFKTFHKHLNYFEKRLICAERCKYDIRVGGSRNLVH